MLKIILKRKRKMSSLYIVGKRFWYIILYIAFVLMDIHFMVAQSGTIATVCLLLFVLYLMWYTYPKPKNEKISIIPLYLCVTLYYAAYGNEIYEIVKVLWSKFLK